MDDLAVTTKSQFQARWILSSLEDTVTWARMEFKPKKSRCMVIRKGRISNNFTLRVQAENIPPISNNLIECLGKWYDENLGDSSIRKDVEKQLKD